MADQRASEKNSDHKLDVPVAMPEDDNTDNKNQVPPEEKKLNGNGNPRKAEYRKQLDESLQGTSINGLSQAFSQDKRKYKIFWLCVFFFGVIAFIINFYNITELFIKRPILTQMERETVPFVWPHFTFCSPANPIPFWSSEKLKKKWMDNFLKAHNYTLPRYDPFLKKKIWEHYIGISSINPSEFFTGEVKASIHSMRIVYERSSIAAYSSALDQFRLVKNIDEVFETRLETIRSPIPCFILKPEKLLTLYPELKTKRLFVIKLYLLMDFESYKTFDMGFESRKTYFYVMNPNSTLLGKFPYYVLPGTDSTFIMKQKTHTRITGCTDKKFQVELYNIDMNGTKTVYGGYDDCRTYLSQEKFVRQCGCYNPFLPLYKCEHQSVVLCTNMTVFDKKKMSDNINCLNKVLKDSTDNDTFEKELQKKCEVYKQFPCFSSSYAVTRYTNNWQTKMSPTRKANMIANGRHLPNAPADADETFPINNMAIMKLEWARENTVATYEEFEYPFSQYMSDFGGIIGLWIGLSVISVFEFLEIMYRLIKYAREPK